MTTKTYTVKKAGATIMSGSLQQFDIWWNKNRSTFAKWTVTADTRALKVIEIV